MVTLISHRTGESTNDRIFFDDNGRYALLTEFVRCRETRRTAADDDDVLFSWHKKHTNIPDFPPLCSCPSSYSSSCSCSCSQRGTSTVWICTRDSRKWTSVVSSML